MRSSPPTAQAALLLCLASPTAAAADEAPRYQTVVRGRLRLTNGSRDDPAAFATRLRIDKTAPAEQLSDLLRRVPGLRIRDHGPGQIKTFSTRAAESHQVVVVLDDIRLTAPGRGAADLSLIDPFHLDAIEVRRSASSTRFGSGALGGSLLLKTRALDSRRRTGAAFGYGAWNSVTGRLAHADKVGQLRYLVSGVYRRTDGDFAFINDNHEPSQRINNDSNGGQLLLKLSYPLARRWHLALLNHFGGVARGAPGPSMNQNAEARQHDLRNLTALHATRSGFVRPAGEVRLAAYHRYGRFGFEDDLSATDTTADTFTAGAQASVGLPLWPAVRLDGGVELSQQWQQDERTGSQQRFSADAFASARLRLWGSRLTLAPAVRLLSASDFDSAWAPKLGLVVRPFAGHDGPRAGLELVANAGRSYRFPSFQELFLRVEGFAPNPALVPEDAWTVDAGLRWRNGRELALELVYFQRWLSNTILYARTGSHIVKPDNYSDARAQGIESAVEAEPGLCLAGRLAYAFTQTQFSQLASPGGQAPLGQLELPGQPEHQLTARLEWTGSRCPARLWRRHRANTGETTTAGLQPGQRSTTPWWAALRGLALQAEVGVQTTMFLDRFNSPTLAEEGRVLIALGGSYTYRVVTVALRLNNLLDKRDAVDTLGFPLAPRSFFVSTSATW